MYHVRGTQSKNPPSWISPHSRGPRGRPEARERERDEQSSPRPFAGTRSSLHLRWGGRAFSVQVGAACGEGVGGGRGLLPGTTTRWDGWEIDIRASSWNNGYQWVSRWVFAYDTHGRTRRSTCNMSKVRTNRKSSARAHYLLSEYFSQINRQCEFLLFFCILVKFYAIVLFDTDYEGEINNRFGRVSKWKRFVRWGGGWGIGLLQIMARRWFVSF